MRKYVALFSLLLIEPISARTYSVPQDEPIATIRIPESWQVRQGGEYIDATTPDGAHVLVMPVEGTKVADSLGEAMRYIRRTGTVVVKADSMKRDTATVKEKQLQIVSWDATDNDRAIRIRCHVVPVADGKQLLVIFWGSLEAETKYQRELNEIFETLQAAKE